MSLFNRLPKRIPAKETVELIKRAREGDLRARDEAVEGNLRLIAHMASKYYNVASPEDLQSMGVVGLVNAVDTFQPEKGNQFSTYATTCIRNEYLKFYKKDRNRIKTYELDKPYFDGDEGGGDTLLDLIEDTSIPDINDSFFKADERKELEAYINLLPKKQAHVIRMYYFENKKHREIGEIMGYTRANSQSLWSSGIKKLKQMMNPEEAENEEQEEKEEAVMPKYEKHQGKGDVQKAIQLLKETSKTYKQISDETGVPLGTIGNYATKHRPKEKRNTNKTTILPDSVKKEPAIPGDTDRAVELLAEGFLKYDTISHRTGVPESYLTVLKRQYENGEYQWVRQSPKLSNYKLKVEEKKDDRLRVPNLPNFKKAPEKKEEPVEEKVEVNPIEKVEVKPEPATIKPEPIPKQEEVPTSKEVKTMAEMNGNSEATQASPNKISRRVVFKYQAEGTNIEAQQFLDEIQDLIETLEMSKNEKVTFSVNVEAE